MDYSFYVLGCSFGCLGLLLDALLVVLGSSFYALGCSFVCLGLLLDAMLVVLGSSFYALGYSFGCLGLLLGSCCAPGLPWANKIIKMSPQRSLFYRDVK